MRRRPLTKRKMMFIISSIYNLLGFANLFVLERRWLPQTICNQYVQREDAVGPDLKKNWERYEQILKVNENLHIPRCIKPHMFQKKVETSLHHLLNDSEIGYSQCSYIWLVNDEGEIHFSLLVGKSRVTPKKFYSIPRLELTAVVLSVKTACLISQ